MSSEKEDDCDDDSNSEGDREQGCGGLDEGVHSQQGSFLVILARTGIVDNVQVHLESEKVFEPACIQSDVHVSKCCRVTQISVLRWLARLAGTCCERGCRGQQ